MKRRTGIQLFLCVVMAAVLFCAPEAAGAADYGLAQGAADYGLAQMDAVPLSLDLADGRYMIAVDLEGGTGRASVTSPAELTVKDGAATATIAWSSPNYDYMMVGGERYLPVSTEGNSVFEIPVPVLDEAVPVVADTTAMSTPHEVEYTLTFRGDSITKSDRGDGQNGNALFPGVMAGIAAAILAVVCVAVIVIHKRRRNF